MNSNKQPIDPDAFQKMLLQLRNHFLDDLPEKLERLENLLLIIEKGGDRSEAFNEFYRLVHSLKGSGGTHGLHIITTICHQLEDLLNITNGGTKLTPKLISISLSYVDLLRLVTENIEAGREDSAKIERRLTELRKQLMQKQFTVLIVDNSKLSTNIYLQVLSEFSVQAVVMHDGLQALMRALSESFDLIITTNEIPLLNGIALIGALKLSDSKSRNAKTVLITSNKSIATSRKRATDADYTIIKDAKLPKNLAEAARQTFSGTK